MHNNLTSTKMPPKKNVDNISEPAIKKEKAPRKRKSKENEQKPKLKTPPVTKVKLPSIKSFFDNPNAKRTPKTSAAVKKKSELANEVSPVLNQSPTKTKNKSPELSAAARRKIELGSEVSPVHNQSPTKTKIKSPELSAAARRKLDLANEVALAQLKQPKLVHQLLVQEVKPLVNDTKVADRPVKKRGRRPAVKKKVTNEETPVPPNEYTDTEEPPVVPKKRILKRKPRTIKNRVSSLDESQAKATSKRKADSTSTSLVEPTVLTPCTPAKRKSLCRKNVAKSKETPIVNSKPEIRRRGEANFTNSVSTTSPSILEEAKKVLKNGIEGAPSAVTVISKPCPADSWKTSTSDCLSWTKDISSSSTTTTCLTVSTNDIVVIDKKLPVLQLSHIDRKWTNAINSKIESDESDSSSSSSSSSSTSSSDSSRLSPAPSLNLSSSSVSHTKFNNTHQNSDKSNVTKKEGWEQTLVTLSASLETLNLESMNRIFYENENLDTMTHVVQDKILKLLMFENEVLKDCECIKQHFISENPSQNSGKTSVAENILDGEKDAINNETVSYSSKSEDDGNFTTAQGKYVMLDQSCADEEDPLKAPPVCEEDTYSPEKANYDLYNNDDDDALSLFAESITGIESSRFNSSANSICANASDFEEYVPQPTTQIHKTANYVPTRIEENEATQNSKKSVCEKQNADSTSIYRDTDGSSQNNVQDQTIKATPALVQVVNRPVPLTLNHKLKPMQGVKSTVFRGVCFYNLISKCKKIRCIFPHKQPEPLDIRSRLPKLSEQVFIQEYMLLRSYPDLRRRYGICYVNECIDRKLTRVLLEMVIDFTTKAKLDSVEDAGIKINVTERALMYLNDVDLEDCADLLKHEFVKGVLLCDVLMQTIGETQNFSRFKAVFVKLICFITGMGKKFQLNVANQILERVCILPCEEPLALAVLAMIKNTDPKIFDHPMMLQFENQLSSLDLVLYGKLCNLREQADVNRGQTSNENVHSPRTSQEVDLNMSLMHTSEREERYTSPDTTKMDNLNKQQDDAPPQVVKIIRPSVFNHLFNRNPSTSYECADNKRIPKFRNWRGHPNYSNMQHMRNQGNMNMGSHFASPMRPPIRPSLKRHSDQRNVVFGANPPKFPRRPGPDFF